MILSLAFLVALPAYDLQAAVDDAVRAGKNRLVLPQGSLKVSSAADYALDVRGLRGFTIEGKGTTLVLQRPDQGLAAFRECANVSLVGFTVDHDVPSMTQGWIRSISDGGGTYEVEIMPGYLASVKDIPARPVGYIFDPKTLDWRQGSIDLYFERVTHLGGRRFRFEVGRKIDHAASVGDLMAFRGKGRTEIIFDACAKTRVDGVTLRSSPGFAIHESGGPGGSFFRYSVVRGPKPRGATVAPLLSSNADAFHSSGVRKGPRVEGCRFEWMADDGVPIHGNYVGVAEANQRRIVIAAPWKSEWFRPGDRVRVYAKGGFPQRTESELPRVVSIQPAQVDKKWPTSAYGRLKDNPTYYAVTLDRDIAGMAPDDLVTNAECQGDGFQVRGNTILNNRARGMLITASSGIIENNTIDGSTIAGIVLSPELYWLQSDYSRNVTIRGNTIRNVSRATVGPWSNQVGGIVVTAEIPSGRLHRDIRIENNTLERIYGPAITVCHAANVKLMGNKFSDLRSVVNNAGRDHGVPAKGETYIKDATIEE